MGLTLAVILFFALFAAWTAAPLLPALIELRRRTDVKPLRVVRSSDVDIRHFAHRFRAWVDGSLGEPIAACRAGGAAVAGTLADGTRYTVLPDGGSPPLVPDAAGPATCGDVIIACGRLALPAGALFPREVYAANSVEVGERTVCRAVLADGDLQLGRGCWSLRWLHARVALLAREGCALHGRASANISMRLEEACRFERLHAPTIAFGAPAPLAAAPAAREPLAAGSVPRLIDDAAGRWLVRGDLAIPAGRIVTADLVATGDLRVGAGALVEGGVKCHGNLVLDGGVEVNGSVVCGGDLRVGRGCRIHGPVIAERDAWIGSGCRLGTAEKPTTLSVRQLEIEVGAVAHGTVWAHGGAVVRPRPAATEVH